MLRRSTLSDPVAETAAWQTELEEMNQTSYFPGFPTFDMSETRRRPASIRRAVVSRPRGRRNVESLQDAEEESEEEKQQPKVKPIDYQGLQYVDNVDESLMCPICLTALHDPVTTIGCGHTFCRSCLCLAVMGKPICPLCRVEVPRGACPITSLILKEQLNRLRVKCPNDECDSILTKEEVNTHYEKRCEWTRVPCQGEIEAVGIDCTYSVPRRYQEEGCKHRLAPCSYCPQLVVEADMERHYRLECDKAMEECEQCGYEVVRGRMNHHKLSECPEGIVDCEWRPHGCRTSMKRKSLSGHENTCVYAAIAKLSSEVAHLKEARRNDKVVIDLLLEGREHDQAEIKQIKDTLALMPGVRDENDHKTPEFLQRQIEEETIGALDTMASRMAAMDSALEIVVPTLETVVHKHELYAMHSDLLNRLRQAMRLNHVVRDQGAMGTNSSSSKETQPSTAGDTAAARPRLQQQRRREDEDRYVPASRRAQNTTSTGTRPPSSRVLQPETARASIYEANRRRRSTDGLRNGAPKL